MVRVFKNIRTKMIDDGIILPSSAPSYYNEDLLFNGPKEEFVGDYQDITLNILNSLYEHPGRTEFECANKQYYLLRDSDLSSLAKVDACKFAFQQLSCGSSASAPFGWGVRHEVAWAPPIGEGGPGASQQSSRITKTRRLEFLSTFTDEGMIHRPFPRSIGAQSNSHCSELAGILSGVMLNAITLKVP